MTVAQAVRCGIYTRKSSDEGLQQEFNSLHAQREACEAYVRSQQGEGWSALAAAYDDGGHSGGTLERPALRRLLADVAARKVDVVVVYKVDRLTRSLPDFARLVEAFDKHEVSFVSVTQAFNTTSSMGRLTLNILLSFAQFEREVTGERIRDKIAASKAKGMWMGGAVPLGYDAPTDADRALVINVHEAEAVRMIFRRYLEVGNTFALQQALEAEGIRSKRRITAAGKPMGGLPFSRGALRHLLSNKVYVGEINHKGEAYKGRHTAILQRSTFDAAQALLSANSQRRRQHVSRADAALLRGRVFDADGQPMVPVFAVQRRTVYRYYASSHLPCGSLAEERDDAIRRVPVEAVEALVIEWASRMLGCAPGEASSEEVRALIGRVELLPSSVHLVIRTAGLPGKPAIRSAVQLVRSLCSPAEQVLPDPSNSGLLRLLLPIRLVVREGRKWAIGPNGDTASQTLPNRKLVAELRASHRLLRSCGIEPGRLAPMRLARAPRTGRESRLVQMAFLAPDIQRAIISGRLQALPKQMAVPLAWAQQRRLLNIPVVAPAAMSSRI